MDLMQAIRVECCAIDLAARDKQEALRALARLACNDPAVAAIGEEEICRQLLAREQQGSTGFGDGVALPHARIQGLAGFTVCIAVCPKGVEFEAIDRRKCRLFFVILGPAEAAADHLTALATISRHANQSQVRSELLLAPTPTALYESFARRIAGTAPSAQARRVMKLMFVVLYMEELLYDILEFFLEQGIDGATILEGSGMGQYISNVPLFAEFTGFMQQRKNHSQTIIALVPADREQSIVEGIEAITGDLDKRQGAMVMTTDLSFHKGSMRMM